MAGQDGHNRSRDGKSRRRSSDDELSAGSSEDSLPELSASLSDTSELGRTKEQIAAQAKAAADQALQLARLAEESARIAHQLNAQAFGQPGPPVPRLDRGEQGRGPHVPVEAAEDTPLSIVSADRPVSAVLSRGRRQTGRRVRERLQREELGSAQVSPPHPLRIRANDNGRQRKRNPVTAFVRQWKSMTISTSVHLVLLLLLGLLTFAVRSESRIDTVLASFAEEEALVEEAIPLEEPLEEPGEQQEQPTPEELPPEEIPPEEPLEPVEEPVAEEPADEDEPTEVAEAAPPTPGPEPAQQPAVDLAKVGSRSEAGKALLLEKYGGTAASESAVQRALEWFASRQRADGSWNFNDVGPCSHAGEADNPMGATAYVLLCYLGAGQTHESGKFKNNVRAGLTYLINNGKRVPAGGDFRGPNCREHDNFYVQAPVAMVLSEAAQMTKDRRLGLRQAAQLAVDFLANSQDPQGGGWRYEPREPGCTSVTVLVAMALTSATNAGLNVPPQILDGVSHYLDTVRSDQSPTGRYGYRVAEPNYRSSTTAMALLGRMYLGWKKDHEELQKGVAILDKRGPYDNLYYCYYATQVMRNWGGNEWERWNSVMRDDLVRTQVSTAGPELGSWTPRDRGGPSISGGRLFTTCLATMTLEVYYRYLPLYGLPEDDNSVAAGAVEGSIVVE